MKKLGISIYPEHSVIEKDLEYIEKAAKHGFSSIFTCLLSVDENSIEETKEKFKIINKRARELGMEVIFDVSPAVFDKFHITYDDLSFFKELYASGIRLDEGFDSHKEAEISYNKEHLKVVINASLGTTYLNHIMSCKANRDTIEACHNFYPQKYTGLSFAHFSACNKDIKANNIPISAFISSQNTSTFGPWPVYEGLCTLEQHRTLPIDLQARHLAATGDIDGIYIANAYASDEELDILSQIDFSKLTFRFELNENVSDIEKEILYTFPHYVRGDMSEYMARSTMSRIKYKDADIPPHDTYDLHRGDVIIVNNEYGRYKGELHIVLKDMPNNGNKNVIGHLSEEEQILLPYLTPWLPFTFIK